MTVPAVLVLGVASVILLMAYSPADFAKNFANPRAFGATYDGTSFAAVLGGSSWRTVSVSPAGAFVARIYGIDGRLIGQRMLDADGLSAADPSIAVDGSQVVAVWVKTLANGNSGLRFAWLAPRASEARWLVPPTGSVGNPDVFVADKGVLDVVFSWQRNSPFSLYLTTLRRKGRWVRPRLLARATAYDFEPR